MATQQLRRSYATKPNAMFELEQTYTASDEQPAWLSILEEQGPVMKTWAAVMLVNFILVVFLI